MPACIGLTLQRVPQDPINRPPITQNNQPHFALYNNSPTKIHIPFSLHIDPHSSSFLLHIFLAKNRLDSVVKKSKPNLNTLLEYWLFISMRY